MPIQDGCPKKCEIRLKEENKKINVYELKYLGSILWKHEVWTARLEKEHMQRSKVIGSLEHIMKEGIVGMEVKMGLSDGINFMSIIHASDT